MLCVNRSAFLTERRNSRDLHINEHRASVSMHADLAGLIHPVGIEGMHYILFVACVDTLYLDAVPLKQKSKAAEKLAAILTSVAVHACTMGD